MISAQINNYVCIIVSFQIRHQVTGKSFFLTYIRGKNNYIFLFYGSFQNKTIGCTRQGRVCGLTLDLHSGFSLYDSESKVGKQTNIRVTL